MVQCPTLIDPRLIHSSVGQKGSTVKAVLLVMMMVMWSASIAVIISSPAKYPTTYFPWVDDECFWVGGIVEKKETRWDNGNYYVFTINGTIDNATPYRAEILGNQFLYATLPVNSYYENEVCNTLTLREAFTNGTIQLIDYGLEP